MTDTVDEEWAHPARPGRALLGSRGSAWRLAFPGDPLLPPRLFRTRKSACEHLERYGWALVRQARARAIGPAVAADLITSDSWE